MTYYDKLMLEYYRVLHNAWKTEIRDATRLAIKMLSDMPRAEKINKDLCTYFLGDSQNHGTLVPPKIVFEIRK